MADEDLAGVVGFEADEDIVVPTADRGRRRSGHGTRSKSRK